MRWALLGLVMVACVSRDPAPPVLRIDQGSRNVDELCRESSMDEAAYRACLRRTERWQSAMTYKFVGALEVFIGREDNPAP